MTSRKFDTPDPDAFLQAAIQQRRAAKKARTRKKPEQNPAPAEPRPNGAPPWTPHGVDLNLVPTEVREAIAELIQPVYEQYVLRATDALEKSLGASIAHLLWLEVLDQFDIRREYIKFDAVMDMTMNRPAMIERHLRLLGSKLQMGYFLIRIKELRTRLAQQPDRPPLVADHEPTELDLLISKLPSAKTQSAQPESSRDCPNFRDNENGTVPFTEANQDPPPNPGKFDVLTPKNGHES